MTGYSLPLAKDKQNDGINITIGLLSFVNLEVNEDAIIFTPSNTDIGLHQLIIKLTDNNTNPLSREYMMHVFVT